MTYADMIMLIFLIIATIVFSLCILHLYIKAHEVYGVPHILVDFKTWVIKKLKNR